MLSSCRGPEFCPDCPILELQSEGDRLDAVNSVILQMAQFNGLEKGGIKIGRLIAEQKVIIAGNVRKMAGYSDIDVSEIAVRAIEKQINGKCGLKSTN